MIDKLIQWFNRDDCKGCNYYCTENKVCRLKKYATCGCHPHVSWFDRHFCKPYKVESEYKDAGLKNKT